MKLALRRLGEPQWDATASNHPTSQPLSASNNAKATLLNWLERAAQALIQRLMADAEPRVWYTCDAEGHLWWHAHDPVTGRSLNDASEAEIRVWLEQRHYLSLVD